MEGKPVSMEIDTCAAVFVMNLHEFEHMSTGKKLNWKSPLPVWRHEQKRKSES